MTGKRRLLTSHRHVSDGLTVTRCPLLSGTVPTAFLVDNLLGRTIFPGPQHPVPGSPKRHGNDVTRTQRARARARGAGGGACGGRGGAGTRLTEAALGAAVGRRRSRGSGSEGRGLRRRVPSRSGTAAAVSGRALTPDRSVPPLTRAGGRGGPGRQSPPCSRPLHLGRVLHSSAGLGLTGGHAPGLSAAARIPPESGVEVAAGRVPSGARVGLGDGAGCRGAGF